MLNSKPFPANHKVGKSFVCARRQGGGGMGSLPPNRIRISLYRHLPGVFDDKICHCAGEDGLGLRWWKEGLCKFSLEVGHDIIAVACITNIQTRDRFLRHPPFPSSALYRQFSRTGRDIVQAVESDFSEFVPLILSRTILVLRELQYPTNYEGDRKIASPYFVLRLGMRWGKVSSKRRSQYNVVIAGIAAPEPWY